MKTRPLLFFTVMAALAGSYFIGRQRPAAPALALAAVVPVAPSLRSVLDLSDPLESNLHFSDYLRSLTAAQAAQDAALLWSAQGDERELNERKRLFFLAWGRVDGPGAVAFVQTNHGPGKVACLGAALAGWAGKNPADTKAWIEGHLKPHERTMYNWALVDGWARSDRQGATDYVLSLETLPGSERFMRTVAGEQVRQGAAQAATWAEALPPGTMRQTAVQEVAARWSRESPADTMKWAASLTDSSLLKNAVAATVREWSQRDRIAATGYLNTMPDGLARNHAVETLVGSLAAEDPRSVATWAATITEPMLKQQALVTLGKTWLATDRPAALAWLPNSGLTAAAQHAVSQSRP